MKDPDFNKYFSGNFSKKEKEELKDWLEKTPQGFNEFLEKRKHYNTLLISSGSDSSMYKKGIQLKRIFAYFSQIAAIFLLAFVGYYWLDHAVLNPPKVKQTAYQIISVPYGQRVNLYLPDSTKVCLNAGTTLKYSVSFNEQVREVMLEGEAYFEVTKNEKLPFHVLAGEHTIEVLGTRFNVNINESEHKFETALFEGAVKVFQTSSPNQAVDLKPNMFVYLADDKLYVKPLTNKELYNWREGILYFEEETFSEMMKVFEKSYGCQIVVLNKQVDKYLYTGKFLEEDGIDYALSLLQKSFFFSYTRDKDSHTILIR